MNAGPQNLRVSANYLYARRSRHSESTDTTTSQTIIYGKREQVSFAVKTQLTRYWALAGSETLNLTNSVNLINGVATAQSSGASIYASVAAIYQDECLAFVGSLSQSGITNGDVKPGVAVMFNVVFKNLGEINGTLFSLPAGLLERTPGGGGRGRAVCGTLARLWAPGPVIWPPGPVMAVLQYKEVRRSMAQFRWSCVLGSCVLAVAAVLSGAAQAQHAQAAVQTPPQAAPDSPPRIRPRFHCRARAGDADRRRRQ